MRLYVIHFVGDLLQGPAREIRGCSLHITLKLKNVFFCIAHALVNFRHQMVT